MKKSKKKSTEIIRSTKCTLNFSNTNKLENITHFIIEYSRVCQQFVDILWILKDTQKKLPSLLPKSIISQITNTKLSARTLQSCAKQASSIVRGTITKHNRRIAMLKKLMREGKPTKKLQKILAKEKLSKPELTLINPELDSRFIEVIKSKNSFDMWIKLKSTGFGTIYIPIKKHKHFNKLLKNYKLKNGCRLSLDTISFNFSKTRTLKEEGGIIGIDVGISNIWSASTGVASTPCPHGHTLDTINKRINKKKDGSKSFKKCQEHRTNYINWSLKHINLSGTKELKRENLYDMRRGKKLSKFLSHWVYPEILSKLDMLCEEQGVLVRTVCPTYTSQRCSQCGWTRKSNRKGKLFTCTQCSYTCDADINGSQNIALNLDSIKLSQRLSQINREGFYWYEIGQEPIVPDVQRECFNRSCDFL